MDTFIGIGIVGCGYVSDMYLARLPQHSRLQVVGLADRIPLRARGLASQYGLKAFDSVSDLLSDENVLIVLNLTNPREHAAVSRAALEAGKHVYSEKPLATVWSDAVELVAKADRAGLRIASAPCTFLGESAQTAWRAVRNGEIGKPLLAYAEIDDGLVHKEPVAKWLSKSGQPWPAKDEFEVGCTMEHAGYYVSWLVAIFGPAVEVTSFSASQISDKGLDEILEPPDAPDFSVGCITFSSGVVARLTCSIIAPHDHSLRLVGDSGTLRVEEAWDFGSKVTLARWNRFRFRTDQRPWLARVPGVAAKRIKPARKVGFSADTPGGNRIDFLAGVEEFAEALLEGRQSRIPEDFCLHVTEIVLTLQDPSGMGSPRRLVTSAAPIKPMPWAAD